MSWNFYGAYEAFDQYQERWDELNRSQGNHILLDSLFVRSLIRHFSSKDTLLGLSQDPEIPGMVLVNKIREGFWQTFQPSQAPLGLILLGCKDDVACQMQTLIHGLPGYTLKFSVLQQDPDFTAFQNLEQCKKIEIIDYIETARLSLVGTFEDYWNKRGKNIVHNLSRQRRRLAERGKQLELAVERDPERIEQCIYEYGRLEQSGWKAKQGTAVTAENSQGLFYQEMIKAFCDRNEGVIYQLLLDGKVVASNLCLERDGMLVILKTAYDEKLTGFSWGLLIHQEIFQVLFTEGRVKVVEFYGRVLDWHLKWTTQTRTMHHMNFYRHRWITEVCGFMKRSSDLLKNERE